MRKNFYTRLKKRLESILQQRELEEQWEYDNLVDKNGKSFRRVKKYQKKNHISIHDFKEGELKISYPGYKTEEKFGKKFYDYRVDLNGIPLSHVNILLDIFNKTKQYPETIPDFYILLKDIAHHGYLIDFGKYVHLDHFPYQPLESNLIFQINEMHKQLGKVYQHSGNENWCYSIKELAWVLSFIVLQEDINYPMPRYEGRRMSFYRYVEALALNDPSIDTTYHINDVIKRTLAHHRPELYENILEKGLYMCELPF